MLPIRVQRYQEKDRINWKRRLKCLKCGCVMKDHEPMIHDGEFVHIDNDCPNSGKFFDWELNPYHFDGRQRYRRKGKHTSGIVQLIAKRDQRARRRGAKLASKHRPK